MDEVHITRAATEAVIEFADPQISTTHLQIGPEMQEMSDEEIRREAARGRAYNARF
jgi:hypothetical protein